MNQGEVNGCYFAFGLFRASIFVWARPAAGFKDFAPLWIRYPMVRIPESVSAWSQSLAFSPRSIHAHNFSFYLLESSRLNFSATAGSPGLNDCIIKFPPDGIFFSQFVEKISGFFSRTFIIPRITESSFSISYTCCIV